MTIQTSSANFRRAIALASKVIERRNTHPILETVRVHANGRFEVTGTDLDLSVTASVAREAGPAADFALMAPKAIVSAVSAAGEKEVRLVPTAECDKVSIASGALAMTAATLPADDFPLDAVRELHPEFTATLSREHIAALARVADAISTEETRYYLNGVHMSAIAGAIRFDATNGHILYRVEVPTPDATGALEPEGAIIPRKAVRLLLDMAKSAAGDIRVVLGRIAPPNGVGSTAPDRNSLLRFSVSYEERAASVQISGKTIDGTFPDVGRVIPSPRDRQCVISPAALRRAVAAVSGHERGWRAVKLAFAGADQLTVSAAYVSLGLTAAVTVPCQHTCAGFEISFNGGYLTSILTAAGGDEVVLDFGDAAAPMLLRNTADTAWLGVMMPMRID